ncbi:hypothetical protein [Granulicatella seriolae]|uniref:DUF3397 family protein n=1 Tax=Granulicatella seriolae TaxID=2967226 RepID=A0ABT1WNI5_9LACT|nr:hypothetical protein [Granulicatella seriolae]
MTIGLIYEIAFILVIVLQGVLLQRFIGNRLYYNEFGYITFRELMLPMLLVWLYVTGLIVVGYSVIPYFTLVVSVIALISLFWIQKKDSRMSPFVFLHRIASVSFFLVLLMIIVLQIMRFL